MSVRKPNLLIITSDQQRGDCYGFEGRRIKTPHLDALARSGTRFSACITPNVVCQPSRASILTGLYPQTHGVWDNGVDLDSKTGEAGWAGQLAKAGYRTGFIGKAHFSTFQTFQATGRPECVHSMEEYPADWRGPYMGFDHTELVVLGHFVPTPKPPPHGMHYNRWLFADGEGEKKLALYATHMPPETGAAQTWHSGLPSAWHPSSWCGDRTIEFLRANKDEPFAVWTSFPDPHHPFDAPEPWSRLHDPEDVDLPPHRTLDLDRRPWWHRASLEGTPQLASEAHRKFRTGYSRIPAQSDAQLRQIIANYYGMIALIDHNVGRILIALDELGLSENTTVIYTTDHGDWLGDHGLILKGPMMYEGLLRVGLIMRGPGIPRGNVVRDPVSTIDLAPTILERAQVALPYAMHGKSLEPLIAGSGGARDFAYNEWSVHPSRCGVALRLRCVRTRTHKLTLELDSGAGELYDLKEDPFETTNRFDDPAYGKVQRELTDMIRSRPDDERTPLAQPIGMA